MPAISTTGAMVEGLQRYNVRKVDVVTPYVETTNERLRRYLESEGIEVGNLGTFDMLDMFDHAKIQPGDVYRKVKETVSEESDAVFVACTQVRALEVVDVLERDLGQAGVQRQSGIVLEGVQNLGVSIRGSTATAN